MSLPTTDPEQSVRDLLSVLGEDADRDGLRDTPRRVVKALREMTAGYKLEPAVILGTIFKDEHDQLVTLDHIEFVSLCKHHLMPFEGHAHVGYIPGGKGIVGISKLARLVECFARRLQVQERMGPLPSFTRSPASAPGPTSSSSHRTPSTLPPWASPTSTRPPPPRSWKSSGAATSRPASPGCATTPRGGSRSRRTRSSGSPDSSECWGYKHLGPIVDGEAPRGRRRPPRAGGSSAGVARDADPAGHAEGAGGGEAAGAGAK